MRQRPDEGELIGGRYRIGKLLGEGGFAWVFLAEHVEIASLKVAVKVLKAEHSRDTTVVARFRREAMTTASLRTRNAARLMDFGHTDSGRPYLVMEYLAGESLDARLRRGALDAETTARLTRDVLKALIEAHALGIVHRDLKPANIMVDVEPGETHESAKVLDFGIAAIMEGERSNLPANMTAGVILCTPEYGAPEVLRGEPRPESDIYALGITMIEMLAGQPPYRGETPFETACLHAGDDPVPISSVILASGLGDVVRTACAKDPDQRYPTAMAMLEALDKAQLAPSLDAEDEIDTVKLDLRAISAAAAQPRPAPAPQRPVAFSPPPIAPTTVDDHELRQRIEERYRVADPVDTQLGQWRARIQELSGQGDWRALDDLYATVLDATGRATDERQTAFHADLLWSQARLRRDVLGDRDGALAALEKLQRVRPSARGQAALEALRTPPEESTAAIDTRILSAPDNAEEYRRLLDRYRKRREYTRTWWVTSALVQLGAATDQERGYFERYKDRAFHLANATLADAHYAALDSTIRLPMRRLARGIAISHLPVQGDAAHLGLPETNRVTEHSDWDLSSPLEYARAVLGVDAPTVYLDASCAGIWHRLTAGGVMLVIGEDIRRARATSASLFRLFKAIALCRPEFALAAAARDAAGLRVLVEAAAAYHPRGAARGGRSVVQLAERREDAAAEAREALAAWRPAEAERWLAAVDRTVNRLALLLIGSLRGAADGLATDGVLGGDDPADAMARLRSFAVTRSFQDVIEALGMTLV